MGFRFKMALTLTLCVVACSSKGVDGQEEIPVPVKWKTKTVEKGLVWHRFTGHETVTGAQQVINVLELDLKHSDLKLQFQYYPVKTELTDAIAKTDGAIAGTNASFGTPHTFIRTEGKTWCDLSEASPSQTGNWYKHEAAIWFDGESQIGFINCEGDPYGAIDVYQATTYPNMFSSRPLMIEDSKYVEWKGNTGFMRRYREPRTAVALLPDGKILFVTVDGRWKGMAAGMTIAELRDFLAINFNPTHAIAMDGGGSTTMFVDGYGNDDGIVNYPCNANGASGGESVEYNGVIVERKLPTFFVIVKP